MTLIFDRVRADVKVHVRSKNDQAVLHELSC